MEFDTSIQLVRTVKTRSQVLLNKGFNSYSDLTLWFHTVIGSVAVDKELLFGVRWPGSAFTLLRQLSSHELMAAFKDHRPGTDMRFEK